MKREQIVAKIKDIATYLTDDAIDVYTSGEMYPKCYVAIMDVINRRPKGRLTPNMLPTHLLAYVQGMASVKA